LKNNLKQHEEAYRNLVENANSIILRIDPTGKILYMNPFGQAFFGFDPEEIIGENVRGTILPVAPSSETDMLDLAQAITKNPAQYETHDNENLRKDGSSVWILWTNRAVLDEKGEVSEILCIGTDVTLHKEAERQYLRYRDMLEEKVRQRTQELQKVNENLLFEIVERKVAEEALRESETRYRSIVEGAVEGIFQTTAEGTYILANNAIARMLGYESPEAFMAVASNMEERLFAESKQRTIFRNLLAANGRVKGFETQYVKKDGGRVWVCLNVRAVYDERGNYLFYEGVVEDITSRKTSEVMDGITRALGTAIEIRDPYTAGHQERVMELAVAIAKEMHFSDDRIKAVRIAAMLHDIGKIYVPAEFLSRPGMISANELNVLRDHTEAGYEILKGIAFEYPVADIIVQHHERMNGSGYPRGLSGDQILLEARIIGVADVVESMGSHRPYRPSLGIERALDEIRENRGILYDAAVVDVCLKLFTQQGYRLDA
jgi:PAS domain S-box-containing protein/putative nucleotidyltransferase with HDIG domain